MINSKAVVFSNGTPVLGLSNDFGYVEKEYASIDQLLGDLRRWWVTGLPWEPVQSHIGNKQRTVHPMPPNKPPKVPAPPPPPGGVAHQKKPK